jgi:hypothetical protein
VDAGRRERSPVVGPDRFGQTDLPKQEAEYGLRILGFHRRQAAAREKRPAEMIRDRERVAVSAIPRLELPLEVRWPHLVRADRFERSRSRVCPLLPPPALAEQSVALEDVVHRTARRPRDRGRAPSKHLQELLRSPSVLRAGRKDRLLNLGRCPMRTPVRRTASLGHPRGAGLTKAAYPLVSGWPRHTVPFAELRHRPLTTLEVLHEPQPLYRRARLHPGHLLGVNDVPGLPLTMCPGRTTMRTNTPPQPRSGATPRAEFDPLVRPLAAERRVVGDIEVCR